MTAAKVDITIEQGTDFEQEFRVSDTAITTQELTGASAIMQLRTQYGDPVVLTLSTASGSLIIDPEARVITASVGWAVTGALLPIGGVHDIMLLTASGLHKRTHQGQYGVSPAVTLDQPLPPSTGYGQFDFSTPSNSLIFAAAM